VSSTRVRKAVLIFTCGVKFQLAMKLTIELQDGHELELTDVGVETHYQTNTIALSVNALIKDLDDETLEAFEGQKFHPLALIFGTEEELPTTEEDDET
jgi:hypothetical protein